MNKASAWFFLINIPKHRQQTLFNTNLIGLYRGLFWNGTGCGGSNEGKTTPCLKLVKIMLEMNKFAQ